MFTSGDAEQLRNSLTALDCSVPVKPSEPLQRYLDFYGLKFDSGAQSVRHSLGYFHSQQFRIACHAFKLESVPARGTVFLVHGYFDHTGLYRHIISNLLATGLDVVIFDLPGHGLSSGPMASIESFQDYTAALKDCLKLAEQQDLLRPWHLLGQSTGASVILNLLLSHASHEQAELNRILLLAPLLRPRNWNFSLLSYYLLHLLVKRTQRKFALNSHDEEFRSFIRHRDPLQSRWIPSAWVKALIAFQQDFAGAKPCESVVQIIQGTGDTTVDWRFNLPRLQAKFPNAKIWRIENARHHLVNESLALRREVFDIVNGILA